MTMMMQIGVISGEILMMLEQTAQPICIDEMAFYLDKDIEMVYMSLGWLAREGHVQLEERDSEYYVSSSPKSATGQGVLAHWSAGSNRIAQQQG